MSITNFVALIASLVAIATGIAVALRYLRRSDRDWRIVSGVCAGVVVVLLVGMLLSRTTTIAVNGQTNLFGQSQPTFAPTQIPTPFPTYTPLPTDTPLPTATPTRPGTVLYQADWSQGLDGWVGGSQWKVLNGQLVNDGSDGECIQPTIVPPFQPSTPDYAVVMQAQTPRTGGCFSLDARVSSENNSVIGYAAFVDLQTGEHDIRSQSGSILNETCCPGLSTNWHNFRLEVRGADVKFYIDGGLTVSYQDARWTDIAGQVGLSGSMLLYVKSYSVIAL